MRFANNGGWERRVKALIKTDVGLVEQARAPVDDVQQGESLLQAIRLRQDQHRHGCCVAADD